MTSFLDKLNLRPQERRWVVGVALVVFVLLNFLIVWPHFGDLGRAEQGLKDTRALLKKFQDEIDKQSHYTRQLKELQEGGQFIASEEQALRLSQEVANQAALTGVNIPSSTPGVRGIGKTNAFFDEQTLQISVVSDEPPLVEFLYNLAARESLTRVRSMTLGPDPRRERLQGNITLVKSFQKKPPPKTAATAAVPPAKLAPPATLPGKSNVASAVPAAAANVVKPGMTSVAKPGTNAVRAATNIVTATNTNASFLKKWFNRIF